MLAVTQPPNLHGAGSDLRALAAGGTGFIGSHIIDGLLEDGYEAAAVDYLSEGHFENLAQLEGGE